MTYLTMSGNKEELVKLILQCNDLVSDPNSDEILTPEEAEILVNYLILAIQRDKISSVSYSPDTLYGEPIKVAQLLVSNYNFKIGTLVLSICKYLVKIFAHVPGGESIVLPNTTSTVPYAVMNAINSIYFGHGIEKLDETNYCVYKKILDMVHKKIKSSISSGTFSLTVFMGMLSIEYDIAKRAICDNRLCDTDMPNSLTCKYIGSDQEHCTCGEEAFKRILNRLQVNKLLKYDDSFITILI